MNIRKRIFALLVAVCMITSVLPVSAFAVGCEHHPSHTAECGYVEAVAGAPCAHECGADCYTAVTKCAHLEHDENCGWAAATEDSEEVPCGHVCDTACETRVLNCSHEHDENCGYIAAVEGVACGFVCEICGANAEGEDNETDTPACTGAEGCEATTHEEGCAVAIKAAAQLTFDEMVAALPAPETVDPLDGEMLEKLDADLRAIIAFALENRLYETQDEVTSLPVIAALLEVVVAPTELTSPLDLTTQQTVDNLAGQGWAWVADTKTLTLAGLDLSVSTGNAITVPNGTTIVLAAGSVNTIETTAASSSRPYGIFTEGTLTIKSADPDNKGALNITSTSRGIGHQSDLTENKNFSLSISDVKLYINATVGINMRPTNPGYDSNLTVSMSGVDYTYACSTIFQMVTDVGGSCLNLIGSNIDGTGKGLVLISGSGTAALTVNNSALTATGYINVGNRRPKSAVLDVQENSTVTTNSYVWISPRDEEGSSGTLNVTKSSLAVEEYLWVGERYADVSIATVTEGSTVNVAGDITIGPVHSDAITKNSKSELTVSGSTLTTESNLYIQRGTVSTMTVKEGSSVTSKGYVMVGADTMNVEKAELTVSDSSLTAGMGDKDESIVVGDTGAKESSATITNSTVIAVSESKGGIQLYPKTDNAGTLSASDSIFFVASLNGGTEIPVVGNNVTTVQFSQATSRDADGNLILPEGTIITSGGKTYTVTEGGNPAIAYGTKGTMEVLAGTTLKLSDNLKVTSEGPLNFVFGQVPVLPTGVATTIIFSETNVSVSLTPSSDAQVLLVEDENGNIKVPAGTTVKVGDDEPFTAMYDGILNKYGYYDVTSTPIGPSRFVGYIVEHYKADGIGYTLADRETPSGEIGDTVTATPKSYNGYVYNAAVSITSSRLKEITTEQDIVVLKLYYDVDYSTISGANQTITKGNTATFTSNAPFDKFVRVEVDGQTIGSDSYTAVSGSTKVTLKAAYIETLSAGEHTLTIVSADGSASTTFTVKNKTVPADPDVPQTGDTSHTGLWLIMMLVGGLGLAATIIYGKKRRTY